MNWIIQKIMHPLTGGVGSALALNGAISLIVPSLILTTTNIYILAAILSVIFIYISIKYD